MARTLGYVDAVRLLGGTDSKVAAALDRIAGGALVAGAAGGFPALLGLIDAKSEVARLGQDAVRAFRERRSGLARHSRTEQLQAAQQVLYVTAFFEVLAEADLPWRFADLELTAEEQARVVGTRYDHLGQRLPFGEPLDPLFAWLAPEFFHTGPAVRTELGGAYTRAASALLEFVQGLAVWDRLTETDRARAEGALRALPANAVLRYTELLRRLGADVPDVGVWLDQIAHEDTRAEVGEVRADVARLHDHVRTGLAGLGRRLAESATGRAPDLRREGLARAYRAALDRPIADSGDSGDGARLPAGPVLPTLGEGYLPPAFRAAAVGSEPFRGGRDRLSDEDWWSGVPVQEDLAGFLGRYLTSPGATAAPLLVLGQPGSGKSVLTKVLAARLPANDFLVVRVVLRDVPAAAPIQDQIEHAVRVDTGERIDWPDLARSAGDAMPVVLLDGFDELLQATGVVQTDYLLRVADFQRREADQGRPVAVVVTTRTSVANRATAPEESVAVRLEPFDTARVTAWTQGWNRINAGWFAGRGLAPLDPAAVLAHPQLATQPLLLLMLALYDADGNALQSPSGDERAVADDATGWGQTALYERLLQRFARREVAREWPGAPQEELAQRAETELRRLSVVAFAMFNRGTQWIGEAALESDLAALGVTLPAQAPRPGPDLRSPLRAAGLLVGRFFFVHRARASHGPDGRLETYEFLHATFGEFLVARFTWQVFSDVAAREAASTLGTLGLGAQPVDDDLLHALLSFAALSSRTPVVDFLREFAAALDDAGRAQRADLAVRLFGRAAGPEVRRERFGAYQPDRLPVPARYAAYTANLLVLALCLAGELSASRLFPDAVDPGQTWHRLALVWRAALDPPEGWVSMVDALAARRVRDVAGRDVVLGLDDGTFEAPPIDLAWTYGSPYDSGVTVPHHHHPRVLRRKANVLDSSMDDLMLHALEPLAEALPETINTLVTDADGVPTASVAHVLLEVLTSVDVAEEELPGLYRRCVDVLTGPGSPLPRPVRESCLVLLLDRMAARPGPDPAVLLLEIIARRGRDWECLVRPPMRQLIDRDRDEIARRRPDLAPVVDALLGQDPRS